MTDHQTITPERQMAAQQVGAVFNQMHEYLRTLEPVQPDPMSGELKSWLPEQMKFAHCRIDEACMWAIKSILTFGMPPAPKREASAMGPEETSSDSAG